MMHYYSKEFVFMRFMLSTPCLDVVPAGTKKEERAQNDKPDEDVFQGSE
jgi:hypothetical protein